MDLMSKPEQDKLREERVAALRELCQGAGMDDSDPEPLCRALNVSPDDLNELMDYVEQSLPDGNPFLDAFVNALQAQEGGPNLTQRRESYLKANGEISARTLMRYEQEGAAMFVRHVELAEEALRRERELQESEDASRDMDISVLRQRVTTLERQVEELTASRDELLGYSNTAFDALADLTIVVNAFYRLSLHVPNDEQDALVQSLITKNDQFMDAQERLRFLLSRREGA